MASLTPPRRSIRRYRQAPGSPHRLQRYLRHYWHRPRDRRHFAPLRPQVQAGSRGRCALNICILFHWRKVILGDGGTHGAPSDRDWPPGSTSSPPVEALRLTPRVTKSIQRFCRHRPAESHPGRNWRGRSPGRRSPRQSPRARPAARPALARRAVAARRPSAPCLRCGSVPD
jgi:hypothetical protein